MAPRRPAQYFSPLYFLGDLSAVLHHFYIYSPLLTSAQQMVLAGVQCAPLLSTSTLNKVSWDQIPVLFVCRLHTCITLSKFQLSDKNKHHQYFGSERGSPLAFLFSSLFSTLGGCLGGIWGVLQSIIRRTDTYTHTQRETTFALHKLLSPFGAKKV